MTQIELINPVLITESAMNPRRFFTKESVQELSESIRNQGLLQPITVRPTPEHTIVFPAELSGKTTYEIVCGARRYKASILAGLETIPCIVREMTDEEAFDAMITENLQRKDVEPMDEARAFNELHKRGTSFEELAARFGKSVSFIRLRIKLNDLVPDLAELLEKKELQISHAQELCKLETERQNTLYKERYSEDASDYYKWNYKPLSQIISTLENNFRDLEKAIFDKTDCETCEFRCGFNALFTEYNENRCMKPECFVDKTEDFRINIAIEKSKEGYILTKSGISTIPEKIEAMGYSIYDFSLYNWENPITAESARKEKTDGYLKAWVIGYFNEDCYKIVKPKNSTSENPEEVIVDNQIAELQSKDKRNAEIKIEKITEETRTLMSQSNYETWSYPTTDNEDTALYALLLGNTAHNFKREVEINFNATESYFENCKTLSHVTKTQIVRAFIQRQITSGDVTYSKEVQSILNVISKEAHNDDTLKIELKHEDTYLKRKENIDKQIKELTDANSEIR